MSSYLDAVALSLLPDFLETPEKSKITTEVKECLKQFIFHKENNSTSFSNTLFELCHKADPLNLAKIGEGFPNHTLAFLMWKYSPNEKQFFEAAYKCLGWSFTEKLPADFTIEFHADMEE
jgi:hypothetical protein